MFWNKWSFAKKTLVSSLLTFALFTIILTTLLSSLQDSNETYSRLINHEVEMNQKTKDIQSLMLQSRRNEKDFLLRFDPKYIGRNQETNKELVQTAVEVARIASESGYSEIESLAHKIESDSRLYLSSFENLAASWTKMGLDHNSGLQGEFRQAVHEMETLLSSYKNTDLYINLLNLRR